MQFSLAAAELRVALDATTRVVERRNTIPILLNIKLAAKADGRIEITASDLDIEVRANVLARVTRPGETTMPGLMLSQLVGKLGKLAEVSIDLGNGLAEVKSGRSKWSIQTLPAEDFPDMTTGDFPVSFSLSAHQLALIPGRCAFAISSEETRYYLNGIYLHAPTVDGAAILRAVATDGHRLARLTLPLPEGAAGMPGIIIPRKTVGEIEKLMKTANGEDRVRVEISETKIRLTVGSIILTSKLIDGSFPDYARVIPLGNGIRAVLPATGLTGAVDRVSTLSSERGRAVKFAFATDELTLTCVNPDAGSAEESLADVAFSGEPLSIGFNARYVTEATARIEGDTAEMLMGDSGGPAILQEPGKGDEYMIVLMPMRV